MASAALAAAVRRLPGKTQPVRRLLFGSWLTGEAAFYAWCHRHVRKANDAVPDAALPRPSAEERAHLFQRCLENVPAPGGTEGVRAFVSSWFFDAPCVDLHLEDVREWLAWGLFMRRWEDMDAAERTEMRGYLESLEHHCGLCFLPAATAEGSSELGKADTDVVATPVLRPSMKPTWESFCFGEHLLYLPLCFYAFVALADAAAGLLLRAYGFQLHRSQGSELSYWSREESSRKPRPPSDVGVDTTARPLIVFAHGMGIGLLPYCLWFVPMLVDLQERGHAGSLLLLRLPYVAMALGETTGVPPAAQELAEALQKEMLYHQRGSQADSRAVLIGHSYGTFVLAQVSRYRPGLFQGAVLLDPMCFMLHLGHITNHFCYAPSLATPQSLRQLVARVVRMEMLVNVNMRRHFFWHQNSLWLEDVQDGQLLGACSRSCQDGHGEALPARVLAVVAEHDSTMPCQEVQRYLQEWRAGTEGTKGLVDLLLLPGAGHGAVLLQGQLQAVRAKLEHFLDAF